MMKTKKTIQPIGKYLRELSIVVAGVATTVGLGFWIITIISFLLLSCSKTEQGELLEIPIDIHQNSSLPLSEIAEEITAIELELTNESLINSSYIKGVIASEDNLIIADLNKVFVFSKDGKFIRSIGSRGQGPGEYNYIQNMAIDEKNKRLFIISSPDRKIITYDLNGNSSKGISAPWGYPEGINYINEELWILCDKFAEDSNGLYSNTALYRLDDDLRAVDSCTVRNLYLEGITGGYIYGHGAGDFILKGGKSVYLYYGNFIVDINRWKDRSAEKISCDTLYQFRNNYLIPELTLKFKNDEISKFIVVLNIYRSSRYIFAVYRNDNDHKLYYFCYDTKTGKGYNMQGGYIDDINQIEERLVIRPSNLGTEMFYYLHTNMKPDDKEEPNPTLYIGKLKK